MKIIIFLLMIEIYKTLKDKTEKLIAEQGIKDRLVRVKAKVLTPEEAIGNPEHSDYPLLKGKERLMQAEYNGSKGVAFTDMFGNYEANLYDIIKMDLINNFRRAIFIATINALLRYTKSVDNTEHCKDDEPIKCSLELNDFIKTKYGNPKILQIGHQPRFSDILSKNFNVKIIDMDLDNIGKKINGVTILSPDNTNDLISWADVLFVTGSTFVNGTASQFINKGKEVIFYGVTCAAATYFLGLNRFCLYGH